MFFKKQSFLFFLIISCNLFSQLNSNSYYSKKEIKKLNSLVAHKVKLQQKDFNRSNSKVKSTQLNYLKNHFKSTLKDTSYVHHEYFESKINRVLGNIVSANPVLKDDQLKFLLKEEFSPNAASFGSNMFEINKGLFCILNNDDELAFVMCHEIAHQKLNHFERTIDSKITDFNDKKLNQEAKKINRMNDEAKINKGHLLVKKLMNNIAKKSRSFEIEADSLGYLYFKNTPYNTNNISLILNKLGKVEETLYNHPIQWKKHYNVDYKGFDNKIAFFEKKAIDETFLVVEDSIKTHPDTKIRISKIDQDFVYTNEISNRQFTPEQVIALESLLQKNNLVSYFYILNILHNAFPEEAKYKQLIVQMFKDVYTYRKNHTLGYYIPAFIKDKSPQPYKDIAHFFKEIDLSELKKINTFLNQ